ncbi:MAG: hypothetical protein K8R69_12250 [Deltaproteobacteria bacterium]|nr:hypothetical protein [Deltaproteobacteria bacterium]
MKNWMKALARRYEETRRQNPRQKLLVIFDIDGTILDMRYMMLYVLQLFDREHGTRYFENLDVEELNIHENQLETFLVARGLSDEARETLMKWYEKNRWAPSAVMQSHRPFRGVLEVIRWFQIQPETYVALNTGRPEFLRADTLRSLNALAGEFRVDFKSELLFMNPSNWEHDIVLSKVAGIRHFESEGFKVVAFIDNEPANLKAVADADPEQNILLLHADTLFESHPRHVPAHSVSGKDYDLVSLIGEESLPKHVQFVWQGVNDIPNLRQFLASNITWGEMDLRMDPEGRDLILRHDDFYEFPHGEDESLSYFEPFLASFEKGGKSLQIDFKEGGPCVDRAIDLLEKVAIPEERLCFKGNLHHLEERGIRLLSAAFARAGEEVLGPLGRLGRESLRLELGPGEKARNPRADPSLGISRRHRGSPGPGSLPASDFILARCHRLGFQLSSVVLLWPRGGGGAELSV